MSRDIDADEASDAWDSIPYETATSEEWAVWSADHHELELHDCCFAHDYPQQAKAFMTEVWPRLVQAIRADLEAGR